MKNLIKLTGRPTIMTPQSIAKLEHAFSMGYNDLEACFYANVSKTTFYKFQSSNIEFAERKEAFKQRLNLKARETIYEAIDSGCLKTSKWYLERKCKEEFSLRTEATGKDVKDLIVDKIIRDDICRK